MKKLFCLLAIMVVASAAWAQDLPKFDRPLPTKTQVLKMRYVGLSNWADKHGRPNEVQSDALAEWYARIRNNANAPLLVGKPALVTAMAALGKWNSAYYNALLVKNRGGTMYSHAANRSVASLADLEADAANAWATHPHAVIDLSTIQPYGVHFKQMPDYIEDKAEYNKAMADESAAQARAKAAVAKLPVGARNVLAKYMRDLSSERWGEN